VDDTHFHFGTSDAVGFEGAASLIGPQSSLPAALQEGRRPLHLLAQ
jgi:hypothetical protein